MTTKAAAAAARMGARAGEVFARLGLPTRNPFSVADRPELAAAWRAAYFAELRRRQRG